MMTFQADPTGSTAAHSTDSTAADLAGQIGLSIPTLYVPAPAVDLHRWAVVACDQFTSQPDYWRAVEEKVGTAPSSLHLVLPELYLEQPGAIPLSERITRINQTMSDYLDQQTLVPLAPGCMLIDRQTPLHPSRKGLLIAIDLEHYAFSPGNRELTRATEGTVLDRIPPRQAIRKDAPLELPHVQLLIDDPEQTVIEPLFAAIAQQQPTYATSLMQGGGAVRGWAVPADSPALILALKALSNLKTLIEYGLLFAVGDGNHSLATAKAHWNAIRASATPDHPARFALAEVINIHDRGLDFEPIHRAVFNISLDDFLQEARQFLSQSEASQPDQAPSQVIDVPVFGPGRADQLTLRLGRNDLVVAAVQAMLDDLIARRPSIRLDYIHGDAVVSQLADQGAVGLLLPPLSKSDFFPTIARDGILPRKTFSMGEAFEKRYYIESRRIR